MSEAGGVPAGREAERYASMRHRKSGRKLGRSPSHRKALMRNLAVSLFRYEKIETTLAKAKEARPFVERLITMARRGTLADRRRALAILAVEGSDPVEGKDKGIVRKLFDDIGPRYVGRPGGYTRVLKLSKGRLSLALTTQGDSRFEVAEVMLTNDLGLLPDGIHCYRPGNPEWLKE